MLTHSRLDSTIYVSSRATRDLGEECTGGRVGTVDGLATFTINPLVVDEMTVVAVRGMV